MKLREVVQRYKRDIYAASDLDAAMELLSQTAAELGFLGACSIFWPHCKDSACELTPPAVRLAGPNLGVGAKKWNASYVKREMFKSDFVYRACIATAMPVVWSYDSRPEIVIGNGEATMRELMGIEQMVSVTGFRGGISVPVRGPAGFFGYVAFTSAEYLEGLLARHEDFGDHLMGMAYRFYDAMADRFAAYEAQGKRLTPRELECLSLLAVGKTLDEVAEILGLSYSTVRFHLHNAERKLGTARRAHAIAKAAFLGLLGPLD